MKSLPHIDDRCPFPPDMWEYIVHNDVWAAEKKLFIEVGYLSRATACWLLSTAVCRPLL